MNGAELLVKTAVASGVEVCFSNPGTTEIPIVMALDSIPGIRAFLGSLRRCLHRSGRRLWQDAGEAGHDAPPPGPGFANGVANLHNARRARSVVLNVVGEHATWHRDADPPLAMDIEGLAKTVSGWWRTSKSAQELRLDMA